jgi:hypothetical protein
MLWLKLTLYDGRATRINMHSIDSYGPVDENGANCGLDCGDCVYQVRETVEIIDDAILNAASPLRLAKGW